MRPNASCLLQRIRFATIVQLYAFKVYMFLFLLTVDIVFNRMKIELEKVAMFGDGLEPFIDVFPGSGVFNDSSTSTLTNNRPRCSNILKSAKIQFLWSDFGSQSNPQRGIISSRVLYESGSISIDCERPVDCVSPGNRTFPFSLESAVEYYKVQGSRVEMFVPPPPRLIPPLPDDIFYPFQLENLV